MLQLHIHTHVVKPWIIHTKAKNSSTDWWLLKDAVNSLTSGDPKGSRRKGPIALGTHCKPLLSLIAYYLGSFVLSLGTKGFFARFHMYYVSRMCFAGKKCAEFFSKSWFRKRISKSVCGVCIGSSSLIKLDVAFEFLSSGVENSSKWKMLPWLRTKPHAIEFFALTWYRNHFRVDFCMRVRHVIWGSGIF